jgi:hypothetical protein
MNTPGLINRTEPARYIWTAVDGVTEKRRYKELRRKEGTVPALYRRGDRRGWAERGDGLRFGADCGQTERIRSQFRRCLAKTSGPKDIGAPGVQSACKQARRRQRHPHSAQGESGWDSGANHRRLINDPVGIVRVYRRGASGRKAPNGRTRPPGCRRPPFEDAGRRMR